MSNKPQTLNQVAVWLPMNTDALDIKTYENYQFMDKGIIRSASTFHPVIRYAKNYTQGDKKFSLCLISQERDTAKMEDFLDRVAEDITYDPSAGVFVKTEVFYGK